MRENLQFYEITICKSVFVLTNNYVDYALKEKRKTKVVDN